MTKSEILNKISELESAKADFNKNVDDCLEKLRSAKSSLKSLKTDLKTSDTVLQSGLNPGIETSDSAIKTAINNIESKRATACTNIDTAISNLKWQANNLEEESDDNNGNSKKPNYIN